jgi:hypothetical protein
VDLKTLMSRKGKILAIAARTGAEDVRIFGSVAAGTAGPRSDLDVLIRLAPKRTLLDIVAFKQDLEEILGCEVHVVTERSISPYMRESVLNEAVRL